MTVRVVMPREVPRTMASRVMWRMWRSWGYSCRPCARSAARRGWVVLEFWVDTPAAREDVLASYEWELDDALLSRTVKARFVGAGARIER